MNNAGRWLSPSAKRDRNISIIQRFISGTPMTVLGDDYGISRERVRQILKAAGVRSEDGGIKKVHRANRKERQKLREMVERQRVWATYRCSLESFRAFKGEGRIMDDERLRMYLQSRRNARARRVPWNLPLLDWWAVWTERPGLWEGRRSADNHNGYILVRKDPRKGFEINNVEVVSMEQGSQHYYRLYGDQHMAHLKGCSR